MNLPRAPPHSTVLTEKAEGEEEEEDEEEGEEEEEDEGEGEGDRDRGERELHRSVLLLGVQGVVRKLSIPADARHQRSRSEWMLPSSCSAVREWKEGLFAFYETAGFLEPGSTAFGGFHEPADDAVRACFLPPAPVSYFPRGGRLCARLSRCKRARALACEGNAFLAAGCWCPARKYCLARKCCSRSFAKGTAKMVDDGVCS